MDGVERDRYLWKSRGLNHNELIGCTAGVVSMLGDAAGEVLGNSCSATLLGGLQRWLAMVGVQIQVAWQRGFVSVVFDPFEGGCVTASRPSVNAQPAAGCSPIWLFATLGGEDRGPDIAGYPCMRRELG
jgi:hypothetical protein